MDKRLPSNLVAMFLSAEGVLYAAFLALDLMGRGSQTISIKYAGILLCLAFSLLCAARGGDRLVPIALALTAGADWFLLVRNDCYILGVALFLCVQTVYFLRLRAAGAPAAWPLRAGLALGAGLAVYALCMASLAALRPGPHPVRGLRRLRGAVQRPARRVPPVFRRIRWDVAVLPALPGAHRPVRPARKGGHP